MNISIRHAVVEDSQNIVSAEQELAKTPGYFCSNPSELSIESVKTTISNISQKGNGIYLVAEHEGQIVGHAFLEQLELQSLRHVAELTIVVHQEWQEKGIGKQLMQKLIEWAKNSPEVEKIELNVRATNTRAISLYKRMGFREEGRLKNRVKVANKYIDDLIMALDVSQNVLMENTTPHQDVNHVIEMLSEGLKDVLQNQLVGIYLTGSLTYGDFDRGSSDIDFLVVMHNPLSDDQRDRVKNLHDRIAKKYLEWAKRIECSYITEDMLHNDNPPLQPRPYVNGGVMWDPDPPYGNEWLLNLYVLYECGVTLVGQDIKALIGRPINIETVREASRKDLHQDWEPLLKDSSQLMDCHFQAYAILTLCRILHRAKNDDVVSKKIASAWVIKTYGMPWSALIEKAKKWQHGQELDAVNETINFIRFTLLELEHHGGSNPVKRFRY